MSQEEKYLFGLLYATAIMLYWSFDGYKEPVFSTIQQIKAQFYQNICLLTTLDLHVFFEPTYYSSSKPFTDLPRVATTVLLWYMALEGFRTYNTLVLLLSYKENGIVDHKQILTMLYKGPSMIQGVSHWSLTTEAWVWTQISPNEICGGSSGSGTTISISSSVFPCHCHSFFYLLLLHNLVSRHC